jgi:hypothetical protein
VENSYLLILSCESWARAKAPPFVVEGFYRVKWGYADEFLRLYKKNHLPVLKRLRDEGRLLRIEVEKPRNHAAERSRWDYRVRLTFRDADAAHDPSYEEEVKKQLFSDQDAYRTEESRRFEILDSHWDVVVDVVDLDTKWARSRSGDIISEPSMTLN